MFIEITDHDTFLVLHLTKYIHIFGKRKLARINNYTKESEREQKEKQNN